jgi:SAM-dependent methyltransferase
LSDAQHLALPDNSVDTIVSFETLEHLPDPAKALSEYFRVCRQSLILTVPNCELSPGMRGSGVIFNHWIDRTHVNFWNVDSISELVVQSGFRIRSKGHINQINLAPLFAESLGVRGRVARLFGKLLRRLQRRTYAMTCLVIADKVPVEPRESSASKEIL